jgi:group I intron endonuclease
MIKLSKRGIKHIMNKKLTILVDMEKSGLYVIINRINGKRYFGSAQVSLWKRWREHKRQLSKNIHDNPHLQDAWNLYGEETIYFESMFNCPSDQCLYFEQILLDMWWDGGVNCYNIAKDAEACMKGRKHSDETRKKLSKSHIGQIPWNKGKKTTEEVKEKLRKANTGKKHTQEHKNKIGRSQKGKKNSPEAIKKLREIAINDGRRPPSQSGKKRDAETLEKMSNSHKGKGWKLVSGKRVWSNKNE